MDAGVVETSCGFVMSGIATGRWRGLQSPYTSDQNPFVLAPAVKARSDLDVQFVTISFVTKETRITKVLIGCKR